jgi:hypothetical protein
VSESEFQYWNITPSRLSLTADSTFSEPPNPKLARIYQLNWIHSELSLNSEVIYGYGGEYSDARLWLREQCGLVTAKIVTNVNLSYEFVVTVYHPDHTNIYIQHLLVTVGVVQVLQSVHISSECHRQPSL